MQALSLEKRTNILAAGGPGRQGGRPRRPCRLGLPRLRTLPCSSSQPIRSSAFRISAWRDDPRLPSATSLAMHGRTHPVVRSSAVRCVCVSCGSTGDGSVGLQPGGPTVAAVTATMSFDTRRRSRWRSMVEGGQMQDRLLAVAARLSDADLLRRVVVLAGREREATVELVAHLAELDARRLYARRGLWLALQLLHGSAPARRARCLQSHRSRPRESSGSRHPRPVGRRVPEPQHGAAARSASPSRQLRVARVDGEGEEQAGGRGARRTAGPAARRGGLGAQAPCPGAVGRGATTVAVVKGATSGAVGRGATASAT